MKQISKIVQFPKPHKSPYGKLTGVALAEWQRIAPRLRKLGRLNRFFELSLEHYCQLFAMVEGMKRDVARWQSKGTAIRGAKSALLGLRRSLREAALDFGFALDRADRMNIARPLPLSTKYDREIKRIERECMRRNLPLWLAPDEALSVVARREYYRVIALPRVRRRMMATGDTELLNEYAKAFERFVQNRNSLRALQGLKETTRWKKQSIAAHQEFSESYEKRCRALATQLGFFFAGAGSRRSP